MRFIAESSDEGERLDSFLSGKIDEISRSYLKKLIDDGEVTVNGLKKKPGLKMKKGDLVQINIPEPQKLEVKPMDIPLDIVYEDSDIIIINKPKGMVVHPAPGHPDGTLVNALMNHSENLSSINGVLRPGIVHRIDKDTTGLLVVCRNDHSHRFLAEKLKSHSITRKYRAIVYGNIKEDTVTIDKPIGRNSADRKKKCIDPVNGRNAVTHVKVLERFGNFTYIECTLETGRTHQIRVHLSSIGHPLLGDTLYGPSKSPYKTQGQCLHAKVLGFIHPTTGKYIEFDSEMPEYFSGILKILSGTRRA